MAKNYYSIDFTSTSNLPSEWVVADDEKVNLGKDGAEFTFAKRYDAPTMSTNFSFFFGRVEYVVKAAAGTGIVSSMVLLSDDLDEIDWEFRGGVTDSVQTNYFGKGYTGTYNRSSTPSVTSPQTSFHTYAVDWSPDALVWFIDGKAVRTLKAADADGNGSQYPQTPMKVSLSLWMVEIRPKTLLRYNGPEVRPMLRLGMHIPCMFPRSASGTPTQHSNICTPTSPARGRAFNVSMKP